MSEIDDYDVPMADPQIRSDYEAALGAYILVHNEADFWLGQIIASELLFRGENQLVDAAAGHSFSGRLTSLGLLRGGSSNSELRNANFMGSAGHVSWTSNAIGHSQQ